MKTDSIIFDLDGTLWDSAEGACCSWNAVLADFPGIKGTLTPEVLKGCMGLPILEIVKKLFPGPSENIHKKLVNEFSRSEQEYLGEHGGRLFPNLEKTLEVLSRNHKLFIVSNCQDGYIQCFFKAHKLEQYFSDFECSGATGLPKGENIKLIIRRNHLKSAVYVGDTAGDAEAARVAGVPFIYARYGFGSVQEYDFVIDRFEDIFRSLDESGN